MITLVDTSIWSLALRRRKTAISLSEAQWVNAWKRLVSSQEAALIGIIRQEILSGVKDLKAFEKLKLLLNDMPYVSTGLPEHDLAAEFYNKCRARGVAASAVDMLICAASVRAKMPILTADADFVRYAAVVPISLLNIHS